MSRLIGPGDGAGPLRAVRGARLRLGFALACAVALAAPGGAGAAIFWVNGDSDSIGAANLARQHATAVRQRLIGGLDAAAGIAAGPDGYIYWSDSGHNRISRARLYYDRHGRLRVEVTRNFIVGADDPQGVAIHGDYIYWANHDVFGSIGRARLDGSAVQPSFITGARGPCMLTVYAGHIYWANSGYGTTGTTIGRATLAGSAVQQRYITGAFSPSGVALDSLRLPALRRGGGRRR